MCQGSLGTQTTQTAASVPSQEKKAKALGKEGSLAPALVSGPGWGVVVRGLEESHLITVGRANVTCGRRKKSACVLTSSLPISEVESWAHKMSPRVHRHSFDDK